MSIVLIQENNCKNSQALQYISCFLIIFPLLLCFRQEKMISGMYMGELARLAMVKFTRAGLLFGGQGSDVLFKRGQFFTKYVSEIEADKPGQYNYCMDVLEEIGLGHATEQDCANVRYICECVSSRAAHLVSAGIASLINKMDEPSVTVSSFF